SIVVTVAVRAAVIVTAAMIVVALIVVVAGVERTRGALSCALEHVVQLDLAFAMEPPLDQGIQPCEAALGDAREAARSPRRRDGCSLGELAGAQEPAFDEGWQRHVARADHYRRRRHALVEVAIAPCRRGADAGGGIEQRSLVAADAAVTVVVADAHVDLAEAEGAVRILGPERAVVHAAVTLPATLPAPPAHAPAAPP